MSLQDFEILTKLGEGAYSSVYKVKRIIDSQQYALKKVKLEELNEKEQQNAINEVRILASIRSPYVISYKEVFLTENTNTLCIIMEYSDDGDLLQKITKQQNLKKYIQEDQIWSIFLQLVQGLQILHNMKILHRDIKCANVFLNQDGTVKLGDMNVSKVAKKGLLQTQTGTPYYASPEVWKDDPYDYKSDIWSLGCVLYEMCCLKPPFRGKDMEELYNKVTKGIYPKIPNQYSQELSQIINMLLRVDSQNRPNCQKILQLTSQKQNESKFIKIDETNKLLNTIKIPKKLNFLTEELPKPNYNSLNIIKVDKNIFFQSLQEDGTHKLPTIKQNINIYQDSLNEKIKKKQEIINKTVSVQNLKEKVQDLKGIYGVKRPLKIKPLIQNTINKDEKKEINVQKLKNLNPLKQ